MLMVCIFVCMYVSVCICVVVVCVCVCGYSVCVVVVCVCVRQGRGAADHRQQVAMTTAAQQWFATSGIQNVQLFWEMLNSVCVYVCVCVCVCVGVCMCVCMCCKMCKSSVTVYSSDITELVFHNAFLLQK